MKILLTTIALLGSFTIMQAQETTMPVHKKPRNNNEIGLMTDYSLGDAATTFNMVGVQYKHWSNKALAFRLAFGAGKYYDGGTTRYLPSGSADTVSTRNINYHLPMATLAVGVEVQKKFYRRLFFYAALELKAGYGEGHYDTVYANRSVYNNNDYTEHSIESKTAAGYYAAFSPAFGLKFNFRKLVIGTEFSDLIHFVDREDGRSRSGETSFNLGDLNQRLYISYRFR